MLLFSSWIEYYSRCARKSASENKLMPEGSSLEKLCLYSFLGVKVALWCWDDNGSKASEMKSMPEGFFFRKIMPLFISRSKSCTVVLG